MITDASTDLAIGFFSGELRRLLPKDRRRSSALPMIDELRLMEVGLLLMLVTAPTVPPIPLGGAGVVPLSLTTLTRSPSSASASSSISSSSLGGIVAITASIPFISSVICPEPSVSIFWMISSLLRDHTARQSTIRASWMRLEVPSGEVGALTMLDQEGSGRVEVDKEWCGVGTG